MNKPNIPQTKFKDKSKHTLKFNLSMMVRNYYIAKYILAKFTQTSFKDSVSWYQGLIVGYDNWFEILGVDQDLFNEIIEKLNRKMMNAEGETMFENIMKMLHPAIILPGQTQTEAEILKKNFMKKIEG